MALKSKHIQVHHSTQYHVESIFHSVSFLFRRTGTGTVRLIHGQTSVATNTYMRLVFEILIEIANACVFVGVSNTRYFHKLASNAIYEKLLCVETIINFLSVCANDTSKT